MKEKKLVDSLEKEFRQFEIFWKDRVYWGGIVNLSFIHNCLITCNISSKTKSEWIEKISAVDFTQTAVDSIQNEFVNYYERLKRIMSIGSKFNDDEFLLLILYHTELYLVKKYLKTKGIELPPIDLDELEEQIKELGNLKQNKKDFLSAINQLRKNSPFPVDIIWMNDDAYK